MSRACQSLYDHILASDMKMDSKNMQSVVPDCAFKELMNLQHWSSGLFCSLEKTFLNRCYGSPELGVCITLNFNVSWAPLHF